MNAEAASGTARASRQVDAWTLLTGGSAALVVGFGIDLLRLGLHKARRARALAAPRTPCGCGAGAR